MTTQAKKLTALEEKWKQEEATKVPSLDDAYTAEGLKPEKLDQSVLGRIPTPTGWRIAILPYRGAEKTKGGIALAEETQRKQQVSTVCGYVLKMGPIAYADEGKFPTGAWCKEGDWIIFGRYAGARIPIDGGEIRLINDDEVLGIVSDPEDVLHMW
jgi:co-chaperonin GroES (HSP10)|uniref:Co-chaperonin GroES n=1 Tax=uncultured virus TaxID=340016 RepID=A0A221S3W2_9VIRU|nr:co-chaperonin GroES [uncultured virus]